MKQVATPYIASSDYKILQLAQRVQLLEEHIFKKKKRLRGTEAQRFLIAFQINTIGSIIYSPITQKQKAETVSILLDIDPDNARKFLSELGKKEKPLLYTESNFTFLVQFYADNGFEDLHDKAEKILISPMFTFWECIF